MDSAGSSAGSFSTSCDYGFTVGRQYVIYARKRSDGRWTTSQCSGTKLLDAAAPDLDYFASLPAAPTTARIYGDIARTVLDPIDRLKTRSAPAAGVPVAITNGSTRITVTTDREGKLDVQVPPGEYTVAPVVPQNLRVYGAPMEVSVPARGCAPVHFSLISNGRIEGRVIGADGAAVPRVSVDVIPADLPEDAKLTDSRVPSDRTDEKGMFSVDAILPGRYVIALNAQFGPRLEAPYATTYFPGGPRKDAQIVELGDGERKTDFTFVVSPLREMTLSGIVTFNDDQAIEKANVIARRVDGPILSSTQTDYSGAFELRLLAGLHYVITATVRTADGLRRTETTRLVEADKQSVRLVIDRLPLK